MAERRLTRAASAWRRWLGGALLCLSATLPSAAGTLVERTFDSPALQRAWTYLVYQPDGYAGSATRYPVLYLLHGHGGSRRNWVDDGGIVSAADRLIAAGDIPPCLIVMPDAGTSWYVNRGERMETAIADDLLDDVDAHWRTRAARSGRLIGGLSMGGYGALRFALRYPLRFAAAALFGPAVYEPLPPESSSSRKAHVFGSQEFDPEVWRALNYPALWADYQRTGVPVPMFVMSGDKDTFFIEGEAAKLYERLRRSGQPAELRIVGGGHDWGAWKQSVDEALRYVFRYVPADTTAPVAVSVPAMPEPSKRQ